MYYYSWDLVKFGQIWGFSESVIKINPSIIIIISIVLPLGNLPRRVVLRDGGGWRGFRWYYPKSLSDFRFPQLARPQVVLQVPGVIFSRWPMSEKRCEQFRATEKINFVRSYQTKNHYHHFIKDQHFMHLLRTFQIGP